MKIARPELIALVVCAAAAALEGIAAGSGVKQRFETLTLPRWAPQLKVWVAIGLAYYVVCFMVLSHLLALRSSGSRAGALTLILTVMLINAYWNWLFFRSRNLWLSLVVSAGYSVVAASLWLLLWRIDVRAMLWLTPYLVYLLYANTFGYAVWRANRVSR